MRSATSCSRSSAARRKHRPMAPKDYDSWRWRLPAPRQPPRKPSSRALPAARTVPPLPLKSREPRTRRPCPLPRTSWRRKPPILGISPRGPEAEAPAALSAPTGKDAEAEPPASLLLDAGGERDSKIAAASAGAEEEAAAGRWPAKHKGTSARRTGPSCERDPASEAIGSLGWRDGRNSGATRPAAETAAEPEGDAPGVAAARARRRRR